MAQIELRNATIRIKDGFSATAAVNNVGGYAANATTMLIDTVVGGPIPVLAAFTVAGDDIQHIVTATNGTTTITFTPGLRTSVADGAVITFTGRTLEVKVGEGNLTYNEQRTMEYKLDRDVLDTVREGADIPMEVALDFTWEEITASVGNDPTIEDALKNRGEAADWVSSSADACEPYAVDVEIEHIPPCGSLQPELIRLPDYRWESLNHNLRDATVATSGKCNAREAIVTRETE